MFTKLIHILITYLVNKFNYQVTNTVIVTETVTNTETVTVDMPMARLEMPVYQQLERTCGNTLVVSTTTELEAGYKLGVASVLEKLRNGYVIDRRG